MVWIIFCLSERDSPRWIRTMSLMWEKWDSSELVVVGIWRSGYLSKVNSMWRCSCKLLTADRSFLCVKNHAPVTGLVVFSLRNILYVSMKMLSRWANTFSVVNVSVFTNCSNSWPASIFGFCVVYRLTIWAWWKWQNCTGMGEKSSGKPLNPSHVTERMVYPSDVRHSFPSW